LRFAPLLLAAVAGATLPVTGVDPVSGAPVTVDAGRPTHLVFLATWCGDCLDELPRLSELNDRWSGRGYRLVLVAVPTRQDAERLRVFAAERRPPGELLWDRDGSVTRALGVDGLPTHILFDMDGREVQRWPSFDESVERAVERLVAEARR
jgi:thiol-disulfide isomerase/thioredoxin